MNYLAIGRLLEDTPAASGDTWSWLVTEVSIFLQVCGGCMYLTKPKMAVNCGTWSIFICTSPNHQTNHSQPQSYGDVLYPQKYSKHGLAHRVTISPTMLMGRLPDSASTARSAATLNRDSSCNNDSFISMQTWGRNTDHHWSSLIIFFFFVGMSGMAHPFHFNITQTQHGKPEATRRKNRCLVCALDIRYGWNWAAMPALQLTGHAISDWNVLEP